MAQSHSMLDTLKNPREAWPWYLGLVIPVLLVIAFALPQGTVAGAQGLPGDGGGKQTVTLTDLSSTPKLLDVAASAISKRLKALKLEGRVSKQEHGLKVTLPKSLTQQELTTLLEGGNRSIRVVYAMEGVDGGDFKALDSDYPAPPADILKLVKDNPCPGLGFAASSYQDAEWAAACDGTGNRYLLMPAVAGGDQVLGATVTGDAISVQLNGDATSAAAKAGGKQVVFLDGVVVGATTSKPQGDRVVAESAGTARELVLAAAVINGGEHGLNFAFGIG